MSGKGPVKSEGREDGKKQVTGGNACPCLHPQFFLFVIFLTCNFFVFFISVALYDAAFMRVYRLKIIMIIIISVFIREEWK